MCHDYNWKVGLEFKSIDQFKEVIKVYSLFKGRDVRYVKNDKHKCRVKCIENNCKWLPFCSKVRGWEFFDL